MDTKLEKVLLILSISGVISRKTIKEYVLNNYKSEAEVSRKIQRWTRQGVLESIAFGNKRYYILGVSGHLYLLNSVPNYQLKIEQQKQYISPTVSIDGIIGSFGNTHALYTMRPFSTLGIGGHFEGCIIYHSTRKNPNQRVGIYVVMLSQQTTSQQFKMMCEENSAIMSDKIPRVLHDLGVIKTRFVVVCETEMVLQHAISNLPETGASSIAFIEKKHALTTPFDVVYVGSDGKKQTLF